MSDGGGGGGGRRSCDYVPETMALLHDRTVTPLTPAEPRLLPTPHPLHPHSPQIALPLTVVAGLALGEGPKLLAFPHLAELGFVASLLVSSAMGLALTYTSVLCTTYNSPLATRCVRACVRACALCVRARLRAL